MSRVMRTHEVTMINGLCDMINEWAQEKGWNETPDSISFKAEQIALMHSELSECLEYVRTKPTLACPQCTNTKQDGLGHCPLHPNQKLAETPPFDNHIPIPGEHAELADLAIRLFHYCGRRGIDLGEAVRMKHAYNISRPYRHGKNI